MLNESDSFIIKINCFNRIYFLDIVLQHTLYATLECHCAAGTPSATALHLDGDQALVLVEVEVSDVAAIFLHEGSNAGFDDLFDHLNGLGVVGQDGGVLWRQFLSEERKAFGVLVSDNAEDLWL